MRLGIWIWGLGCLSVTAAARGADFTYDDLTRAITQQNLTRIEDVLPQLPADLRSNYTLMQTSRSLQGATSASPRVILFGSHGQLVCTFNGDVSQAGGDLIECYQFHGDTRTFDFRQIQFPTAQNGLAAVRFSDSNRSVDGKVSCSTCHAADPRPNWDGYSVWTGAYGANDDSLDDLATAYAAFVKQRPSHPRYRWLIQADTAEAPYGGTEISGRPNLRFSDTTGRLNSWRAARLLQNRAAPWQSLVFAYDVLGCTLAPEDAAAISKAGLDFQKDSDAAAIFALVGVEPGDWSTQVLGDSPEFTYPPWEHQSGFSFLAEGAAMAMIRDRAQGGDSVFQDALTKILASYPSQHSGDELQFFQTLYQDLPDLDHFGGEFETNKGYVCPELAKLTAAAYLAAKAPATGRLAFDRQWLPGL
jgi:hypothetical protein